MSEIEQEPSLDLPPIPEEATSVDAVRRQGTERNTELLPAVSMDDPSGSSSPQGTAQGAQNDLSATSNSVSSVPTAQNPAIADDVDLIEKEWVEKAKEIVEKTKDNPYLQNKAISEFKADYIKKRYNKDLIVSEE
jgi:hypothetical protein